jgi:hypothetical protein
MKPYLPPQSTGDAPRVKPFAKYERLNLAATLAGVSAALLVYAETRSLMLGLATVCASLLLCLLQSSVLSWLSAALTWRDDLMDHRKVSMPEPRKQRHNGGFTLPQVMHCIGALLLAHAVVIALHFIVMTVMGAQEPKW